MRLLPILVVVHVFLEDLQVEASHVVQGLYPYLQEAEGGLGDHLVVLDGHSLTHYHLTHQVDDTEHVGFV